MGSREHAWDTKHELKFLETLGQNASELMGFTRQKLLFAYRDAMAKRKDWGHVDRRAVAEYVNRELRT